MPSFRIAVIGAGQTGAPLLQQLLEAPFVELAGVADLDLDMPGIALARQHGVPVTTQFLDLLAADAPVDIVIDVTGQAAVRDALRKHMVDSGNTHTVIMHERIALLLMSLSAGQHVSGKHGDLAYA
mgnify:FL=1